MSIPAALWEASIQAAKAGSRVLLSRRFGAFEGEIWQKSAKKGAKLGSFYYHSVNRYSRKYLIANG
jgi:hypothetical protein